MYASKLDGEGAAMYDTTMAMKEAMIELEVAIDGGKNSLSMAAQAGGETVKCPGNLVIYLSGYNQNGHSRFEAWRQGCTSAHRHRQRKATNGRILIGTNL